MALKMDIYDKIIIFLMAFCLLFSGWSWYKHFTTSIQSGNEYLHKRYERAGIFLFLMALLGFVLLFFIGN